MSLTKKIN